MPALDASMKNCSSYLTISFLSSAWRSMLHNETHFYNAILVDGKIPPVFRIKIKHLTAQVDLPRSVSEMSSVISC